MNFRGPPTDDLPPTAFLGRMELQRTPRRRYAKKPKIQSCKCLHKCKQWKVAFHVLAKFTPERQREQFKALWVAEYAEIEL